MDSTISMISISPQNLLRLLERDYLASKEAVSVRSKTSTTSTFPCNKLPGTAQS